MESSVSIICFDILTFNPLKQPQTLMSNMTHDRGINTNSSRTQIELRSELNLSNSVYLVLKLEPMI